MDITLSFIPESKIQSNVRTHLPLVAGEQTQVNLVSREIWAPRVKTELGRPAAQRSNLCRGITHLLKQKGAAISFDRLDGCEHRISRAVKHRLIVRIKCWGEA